MIENAWFSGSMNYLGRARRPDGSPEYEATYELNASLEISRPEFAQLVSHEVVPGHVTTFAYLQDLYVRGVLGFEASVLTMNTRPAALFEGIANNAILMAHGVLSPEELPDRDLETGCLLALLQDDAKNQSSWLTWNEKLAEGGRRTRPQERLPRLRRARRQALGRLGPAPAPRPDVPAGLPGRDGEGRRAAAGSTRPRRSSRRSSAAGASST